MPTVEKVQAPASDPIADAKRILTNYANGMPVTSEAEEFPSLVARVKEKDAAKDRYLSEFLAERSKRDRQAQAWELLLTRSYDEPPTWARIFDDLSPKSIDELGSLYDALPAGAQEEYTRRFGVPSGV